MMKYEVLGLDGCRTIAEFVENKLARLETMEPGFSSLFPLMFSERDNIMYERSTGYRIRTTSYGEAYAAVLRAVPMLRQALPGLRAQSVVGLYMQNSVEWIELFWAILAAGFCPLLMNTRLNKAVLEDALADAGAAAVISDGPEFSVPTLSPADLLREDAPAPSAPDDPFGEKLLIMSSGTSDRLKLCAYTAEEFRHQIRNTLEILRRSKAVQVHYEGRLKLLTFLPFYHVFGLVAVYIWFAFFSRTFVHLADFSPQTILGTIRKHKVTHIFAVPLFWETVYAEAMRTIRGRGEATAARFEKGLAVARRLGNAPKLCAAFSKKAFREVREELFGESVRFMITGGSEIRPEVLEFFNAVGYPLANGYGMSEIGITSVELSPKLRVLREGFVGKPLPSVEYSLRADGELLVRGPSLARFVLEGGKKRVNDGWFPTGDLAECVGGHWRILGRKDDLVVASSGENLNPNLIEPLFDIPGVRQVCLISDAAGAPVLLASVGRNLPAERLTQLEQALHDRAKALGLSGQLARIVPVEDELRTEQEFKLCRARLTRDYRAGALTEAKAAAVQTARPEDPCYFRVTELFAAALGKSPAEIGPETDFFLDGGGSSLDYFALVSRLREEFGIEFPTADGESISTPEKLYRFIQGGG